jgi:hypothetical protein
MRRDRFPDADDTAIHQDNPASESVTSVRERNRERKRLQRARARAPILYERDDWRLFLDPETLPQKAGCQPEQLAALVLKELVDNALDEGARATLNHDGTHWIVSDDGPGIDPDQVAMLFAVNRPLRSSKLKRLPTRGMLGNGLRVVMAWARRLAVETRGQRLTLAVDDATGRTTITHRERIDRAPGLTVFVRVADVDDDHLARVTLALAGQGAIYHGPSLPHWYGAADMARLMQAAPEYTRAADVIRDLGLTPPADLGNRLAHDLGQVEIAAMLREMQRAARTIKPDAIGTLGNVYTGCQGYARRAGIDIEPAGGHVPYVIEASVRCVLPERKGQGSVRYWLMLNRSVTVAHLAGTSRPDYLSIDGCGLDTCMTVPTGDYAVYLSLITSHVQLTSDGKAPSLAAYAAAVVAVVEKAARQAHARAARPERLVSIKAAAWQVMRAAYLAASANGTLPANARQIMYAARRDILRLTGKDTLDDHYFTQTLLPGYIEAHPEETTDWDVVFDDRGAFTEPHTGRVVGLGTIAVREYLGERPPRKKPASLDPGLMAATVGPRNRYRNVLFIEKEGFAALLAAAQIAERFDLAIMSTKGLSVTAARALIDGLMRAGVERVFVLHDFDVSGFSIFGTLGTSSRRYRFQNPVEIVDLGLRIADIETMRLDWEPYSPSGNWLKRAETLRRHGATRQEIRRLRTERVELNAMPSDVFVRFLADKLIAAGVRKMVPDSDVLDRHARHVIERAMLNRLLKDNRAAIDSAVAAVTLPVDLRQQVEALLRRQPALPWDIAVAVIAQRIVGKGDT